MNLFCHQFWSPHVIESKPHQTKLLPHPSPWHSLLLLFMHINAIC